MQLYIYINKYKLNNNVVNLLLVALTLHTLYLHYLSIFVL